MFRLCITGAINWILITKIELHGFPLGAHNSALWGELLTAAKMRGASGAVLDGCHRDTPQVLAQDFPVLSQGCWAQDSSIRTYVAEFRCPVEIGQVTVMDGDIVFGDIDGVLVIPSQVHEGP